MADTLTVWFDVSQEFWVKVSFTNKPRMATETAAIARINESIVAEPRSHRATLLTALSPGRGIEEELHSVGVFNERALYRPADPHLGQATARTEGAEGDEC
jgi:hypothetical protein